MPAYQAKNNQTVPETLTAYRTRIEDLRKYGAEEGVAIRPESLEKFWEFINSRPCWRKGLTELLDNGDLRAIWDDKAGNHLGLQFLGGDRAGYVIFQHDPQTGRVNRTAGVDTFKGIDRRIQTAGLLPLVTR